MFTETDYKQYFMAIQQAEQKMLSNVSKMISEISDTEMLDVLRNIKRNEISHLELTKELQVCLKLVSIEKESLSGNSR